MFVPQQTAKRCSLAFWVIRSGARRTDCLQTRTTQTLSRFQGLAILYILGTSSKTTLLLKLMWSRTLVFCSSIASSPWNLTTLTFAVRTRFKLLHMISRMTRHFGAPDAMLHLFWALIRPRLELAFAVWNNLWESECKRTEAVQIRSVRIVYNRHFPRGLRHRIPFSCLAFESKLPRWPLIMPRFSVCK